MEINYLGHSCFKITGKNLTVLVDPFDPKRVGLKMPKADPDVLLLTHDHTDHNFKEAVKSDYLLFDSPGQYEVKECNFEGIDSFHDDKKGEERGHNTVFTMDMDNIRLCHLGDLGSELSSGQLEEIDGVDILFIPVGGKYTIDAAMAVKIINDIEPKIVIPMHYRAGAMTELDPLDKFLTEIGEEAEILEKLKIVKKDLPEQMKIIVLK